MKQIKPHVINPRRRVMVINDELCPGVEFSQNTKSGDRWVLFFTDSDRLYRWDRERSQWMGIQTTAISHAKQQQLKTI
jgi:hypothetical protein